MRILILATWFYPDTAIGAKRPYFFAKYLAQFGHEVSVLRSGSIMESIDASLNPKNDGFRIVSYLGPDSPAEKFECGDVVLSAEIAQRNFGFLPTQIRQPLVSFYRKSFPFIRFLDWKRKADIRWASLKQSLDTLKKTGEQFDVIFATFGELENMQAGEYASQIFDCPWVIDLRDPIVRNIFGRAARKELLEFEQKAIQSCAACTVVSRDLAKTLSLRHPSAHIHTIHNGYDGQLKESVFTAKHSKLVFCYTGTLYAGKSDLTPIFAALHKLSQSGKINLEQVQFDYAGKNFPMLQKQAAAYGLTSILTDHGYVSKEKASMLQAAADFFIVASWNTQEEQGILTGKFYEGIRAQKPILSILVGDVPNSELYLMNEEYRYGFCYEECQRDMHFDALCNYIKAAYDCKMRGEAVAYQPKPELAGAFHYEQLAKKLELLFCEIANQTEGKT